MVICIIIVFYAIYRKLILCLFFLYFEMVKLERRHHIMNEMPLGLMWDDEKYIFCEIVYFFVFTLKCLVTVCDLQRLMLYEIMKCKCIKI